MILTSVVVEDGVRVAYFETDQVLIDEILEEICRRVHAQAYAGSPRFDIARIELNGCLLTVTPSTTVDDLRRQYRLILKLTLE